jgi:hypothetical protein
MKTSVRSFFVISIFIFSSTLFGQVSNLLVNGSSTHFSMASGDQISWSYNLPVGDTATLAIWIDANGNSTLEPGTDVLWQSFYQIDGRYDLNGPPDMDSLANGQIIFAQEVGLAPVDYIMSFTNNSSMVTISGTVSPITSPVFTISGNVVVPLGQSAQYIPIALENYSQNGDKFWNAITDASGNFSVQMDADTSGNPWRLKIENSDGLNPAIVSPDRISIVLDAGVATTYTGNNFVFTAAAAEINGSVKDDDGNSLINSDVHLYWNNGNFNRYVRTDFTGNYRIGFLPSELPASNVWLGAGNNEDISIVSAVYTFPSINSGDILTKNLVIYRTNSTITGNVTLDGNSPNMELEMYATVTDSGYVRTFTDFNGNYTLHVSNKLYNYNISPGYLPPNYNGYSITAHPGQTNVNFNFTLTDIESSQSLVPNEFLLEQNFPNPFNPRTSIRFNLPESGMVKLTLYNILGQEIRTLVNEFKEYGTYTINFNASDLNSGMYIYKIETGSFVQTRKMSLVK